MSDLEDIFGTEDQPDFEPGETERLPASNLAGPIKLTYTADFYNRYPGELVTLFARVTINRPGLGLTLRINLPKGLQLDRYQTPAGRNGSLPYTEVIEQGHTLVWSLEALTVGTCYEYQLTARAAPTQEKTELESRAVLTDNDQTVAVEAYVTIAVSARGSYLQYLPAFYEQDDLVGRFLMFCESFWAPLEHRLAISITTLIPA